MMQTLKLEAQNMTHLETAQFSADEFPSLKGVPKNHSLILTGKNLASDAELESILKKIKFGKKAFLKNALREKGVQSVGILQKECLNKWDDSFKIIQEKIDFDQSHFVLLVPYEVWRGPRKYQTVESFLASLDFFVDCFEPKIKTGLCFHLSGRAINKDSKVEQILVNQPGHPNPFVIQEKNGKSISTEMVIPHKGELDLLNNALYSIQKQQTSLDQVSICFDEFITDEHFKIVEDHSDFRFFTNHPTGVGPYPPRDVLARTTEKEVIFFHDSDDFSTMDRVIIQREALNDKNIDVVGSHEIRLNKITQKVLAVRYPLETNKFLEKGVFSSIFFPTTAIRKTAYLKAGGLSTIRRHSSDTQFWWRAHFYMNLISIDEFLYIRVKREGSLTTASDTALGSPVRDRIRDRWQREFMKVRDHKIPLVESTLVDEYRDDDFSLIPLKQSNRELIFNWQKMTEQLHKRSTLSIREKPKFPSQSDILEGRVSNKKSGFKDREYPDIAELKKSVSWKIGWAITRAIIFLVGWIPFVKRRIE